MFGFMRTPYHYYRHEPSSEKAARHWIDNTQLERIERQPESKSTKDKMKRLAPKTIDSWNIQIHTALSSTPFIRSVTISLLYRSLPNVPCTCFKSCIQYNLSDRDIIWDQAAAMNLAKNLLLVWLSTISKLP